VKDTVGERVEVVRGFNRLWTREVGLLRDQLIESPPFSLTEARVLYELAHADGLTANALAEGLHLDRGYVSRILRRFKSMRIVSISASRDDRRRKPIQLTAHGRHVFDAIDVWSASAVRGLLERLDDPGQRRLVGALASARASLETPERPREWKLRDPGPGDLGWVIERHGALYAREYGWDWRFEALVARVCADFVAAPDQTRQRIWIAEADGARVGSIFCTRKDDATAQLRLLLVEPHARGLGIGARLIDECVAFARGAGYRKLVLWTNSVLDHARRLYEHAGFTLVEEAPHDHFGEGLIGQTWSLALGAPASRTKRKR
jgi:DNA-binding MarR family transcriptional regulator/GNAT superfamily N-acetyltransferase